MTGEGGFQGGPAGEEVPPVLSRDDGEMPQMLRLVIAGGSGTARELAGAVQDNCARLAGQMRVFQREADAAQAQGDALRQALCRGQLLAYRNAAEGLAEDVVERFDLWNQVEGSGHMSASWSGEGAGESDEQDQTGIRRGPRAPMVLPETSPDVLARAVAAIERKRDMFGATAVRMGAEARTLAADGEEDRCRLGALAQAYAMAADHLDEALATAYGRREEYDAHVSRHGLWAERTLGINA